MRNIYCVSINTQTLSNHRGAFIRVRFGYPKQKDGK
jgi:hypothetical protein